MVSMLDAITHPNSLILLAMVAAGGLASHVVALGLLRYWSARFDGQTTRLPVAPFFAAVTTIWALMFGFVAAEIWRTNSDASTTALAERSAIQRLAGMADETALDLPLLRGALFLYVEGVVADEWGAQANARPSPRVDEALQAFRLGLIAATRQGMSPILLSKMIADFDELQDARNERLAIGSGQVASLKWALVAVLALLSQASVAFVHTDRPAAGRTALMIFTVAACASIWLVALHALPYSGGVRISETEIAGLAELVAPPPNVP
ncbi:MAG: DUF4239 domain-containing protein [Salinarimonadaceae bacterium]|nr:MAG: DUF4239 domain-containing protein [Salinarimonadaceae bacterium]